jgi:hypothetical protein
MKTETVSIRLLLVGALRHQDGVTSVASAEDNEGKENADEIERAFVLRSGRAGALKLRILHFIRA